MESIKLSCALLLISLTCMSVAVDSSKTKLNQVWWTRKTLQPLQTGCAAMCCTGRDSSCYSTGPRMGGKTAANGRCFCDEGCLDMDDCCEDYSVECQGRINQKILSAYLKQLSQKLQPLLCFFCMAWQATDQVSHKTGER